MGELLSEIPASMVRVMTCRLTDAYQHVSESLEKRQSYASAGDDKRMESSALIASDQFIR